MERFGLVACIEEQLERTIGAELLPEDRGLPSEVELARRFGVCRTTIREALRRLAARGLVVQHPGRRTRAVAVGEALTLESLAIAMHGEGRAHLERRRLLLEGYFALKRETLVELLADCREHASAWELQELGQACFALRDAARWEENWVEREFELLRLAAQVARRPGHLLLIHSLERAWRGIQARVLPHLDAHRVRQWAECAMDLVEDADVSALKRKLLPLLRVCDERLLERLVPIHEEDGPPRQRRGTSAQQPHVETEPAREEPSDAVCTNRSACQTCSSGVPPQEDSSPAPSDSCLQPQGEPWDAHGPHPGMGAQCASSLALPERDLLEAGGPCPREAEECASFTREEASSLAPAGTSPEVEHPLHRGLLPFQRAPCEGEHAAHAPSDMSRAVEYGAHARRRSPGSDALPDLAEADEAGRARVGGP